jgi:PAS domain S-box-containing protein
VVEGGRLVLVVEDDPGIAVLQRRGLERAGFRVVTADTLDQARALMLEHPVSLVVLDYRLQEEQTGFEFHRWMQASGYDVPVIMVTGASDDATAIRAMRAGVRDFVIKSIDYLNYLPEAAKNLLDRPGSPAAVAPEPAAGAVLLVEDDPGIATLERRRLERAGFAVRMATNAEEAMDAVRGGGVMMAVLDLRLPDGVTGLDVYARLKAEGNAVPAVVVTAFPAESAVIEALRLGIRDFVPKTGEYLDYLPRTVERIADQIRLERRLAESERRMASLVATAMDAIVTCDQAHQIVVFNAAAERMFGRAAADALGRSIEDLIPGLLDVSEDDEGLDAGSVASAGHRRLPIRWEGEARRADGTTLPVEVSISHGDHEDPRALTVIARDITERRRAEASVREADRRKDEFLGMLAHELRNPLAAITNASEVLRHLLRDDERAASLNAVVVRQTRALAHMVNDLLDLSRVTVGKISLAREPVVLSQVVTKAVDSVWRAIDEPRHELLVDVESDPIWVDGDPTRLEQVLVNLLTNAAKFTPPGGRIELTVRREAGQAVVRVKDTGIGMSAELLPHVFGLFVQADRSLERTKGGLGIGLALVRQLVTLHGGSVSAHSEGLGRGSEFVVRLPLLAHDRREPAPPPLPSATRRLRVLIVDDQPDMADVMTVLVQMLGHDARATYDGKSGLVAARADPPDLILVDIGMAGMTGYEFARLVRREPALASTRLVAVTGYGRPEDRERAREAGFDRHLTKPVVESTLQSVLADVSQALT